MILSVKTIDNVNPFTFFSSVDILLILNGFSRFNVWKMRHEQQVSHDYAHYSNALIKNNPFTFRSRWRSDSFRSAFSIINYIKRWCFFPFFQPGKMQYYHTKQNTISSRCWHKKRGQFIFHYKKIKDAISHTHQIANDISLSDIFLCV